jgi:hypothetical protein
MCQHRWKEAQINPLTPDKWLCPSCVVEAVRSQSVGGLEAISLILDRYWGLMGAYVRAFLCVPSSQRLMVARVSEAEGYESAISLCALLVEQRLGFDPTKHYVKETTK